MIIRKSGNIIDMAINDEIDVIVHGCNCVHKMKSGLAKEIVERVPKAKEIDLAWSTVPDKKLGHYTYCLVPRIEGGDDVFIVVNAYIQLRPATMKEKADHKRMVNYEAMYTVLERIRENLEGLRIGFPRIGCGLAGGSWKIVETMIEEVLGDQHITIVDKK